MNLRISISLSDCLHINVYSQYCIKYLFFKIEVIVDEFVFKVFISQLEKERKEKERKRKLKFEGSDMKCKII